MKYFDIQEILKYGKPFNIVIGGRGIGKTYSSLRETILNHEKIGKFLYLRNTTVQIDKCCTYIGNPYKKLNTDYGWKIECEKSSDFAYFSQEVETDEGADTIIYGYAASLSTFENLRGFDMSDVNLIIFDEFIERRKLMYNQLDAFLHMYETVNRNRELDGKPALQVIMLSNAQTLNSPILAGLGLIDTLETMMRKGKQLTLTDVVAISLPADLEISEAKKETALYKLSHGTQFYEECINNLFAYDSFYNVGTKNLKEYKCISAIDGIYAYTHKSDGSIYICWSRGECIEYTSKDNLTQWYRHQGVRIRDKILSGKCYFSDYTIKCKLYDMLNL